VALMGGRKNTYSILVGKTEGNELRRKPMRRMDDYIKVDLLISTPSGCTYLQDISCKDH
jgi:hypothetical protein